MLPSKNDRHVIISAKNTATRGNGWATPLGTVSARLAQPVSHNNVRRVPTILPEFPLCCPRRALNITIPSLISILAANRGYKYYRKTENIARAINKRCIDVYRDRDERARAEKKVIYVYYMPHLKKDHCVRIYVFYRTCEYAVKGR